MMESVTPPVFRFYREAIGRSNIRLAEVDETDALDFVSEDDTILLRSANEKLVGTIMRKGIRSTAESSMLYELVKDKKRVGDFLREHGVPVPPQCQIDTLEDGVAYFVKPRYGSDSLGITADNICRTKEKALNLMRLMKSRFRQEPLVEKFIQGREYTVACCRLEDGCFTAAIGVDCDATDGIQTQTGKANYMETGFPLAEDEKREVTLVAKDVFNCLRIKHHCRIDMRRDSDGKLYVIDINLIPGLAPTGDWARCLLLDCNYSYRDALRVVLASASR